MEHSVNLVSAWGEYETNRVDHPNVEAEANANKQRRRDQNRKNQRAHREFFPQCPDSLLGS